MDDSGSLDIIRASAFANGVFFVGSLSHWFYMYSAYRSIDSAKTGTALGNIYRTAHYMVDQGAHPNDVKIALQYFIYIMNAKEL